jgi:hypothetical protein
MLLASFAQQTKPGASSEYPTPEVREEQTVVVDGRAEVWRLQWAAPPKPVCPPSDSSLTCPCTGFAFGEGGDLVLTRSRAGMEVDRLPITPFFDVEFPAQGRLAIVQRWLPNYTPDSEDWQYPPVEGYLDLVSKRPVVQLMHFADYEHNGAPNEFYLQTTSLPCGKSAGVVIGVSRKSPRLHAVGTAPRPDRPLYLKKDEWEALRDASGPVDVLDWACGDHGADTETTVHLHWSADGVDGTRREYTCPVGGAARRLIREEALSAKQ